MKKRGQKVNILAVLAILLIVIFVVFLGTFLLRREGLPACPPGQIRSNTNVCVPPKPKAAEKAPVNQDNGVKISFDTDPKELARLQALTPAKREEYNKKVTPDNPWYGKDCLEKYWKIIDEGRDPKRSLCKSVTARSFVGTLDQNTAVVDVYQPWHRVSQVGVNGGINVQLPGQKLSGYFCANGVLPNTILRDGTSTGNCPLVWFGTPAASSRIEDKVSPSKEKVKSLIKGAGG